MKLGLKKLALVAVVAPVVGCAYYTKHQTQIDQAVKDEVACVLTHYAAGDPPAAIAAACGGLAVTDVIDIVASVQKAGLQKAPAPAPSTSASGK
jgi:hypothetical protein